MSNRTLRIILETLSCTKTTEAGEDEVYLAIGGWNSQSGKFSLVAPDPLNHWDMNDGGDKQTRDLNYVLYSGVLPTDSVTDIDVLMLEQDGGTPQAALQTAAELAAGASGGNPYVLAGAAIAEVLAGICGALGITDSDDWLGGFHLTARNDKGDVKLRWQAGERSSLFLKSQCSAIVAELDNLPPPQKFFAKGLADYYRSIELRCGANEMDPIQRIMFTGDGSEYGAFVKADIV